MIHRVTLNRRRLLGANYDLVSGITTTWVSGETLDTQWTNANQYPTVGNPSNYPPPITPTNVSGSTIFNQNLYNKTLTLPLELKFEPTDYSDNIDSWVGSETQKAINSILDGEKVQYISSIQTGITIEFRFSDRTTQPQTVIGPYTSSYTSNGFVIPTEYTLNKFNKSYFRLYFYDSNTGETANLLFTEDLPVKQTETATFNLKKLFWEKDDVIMNNTFDNRTIYMEARFFNAKTGQIQTFYCPPASVPSPIGIDTYSLTTNRGWRTSPIILINPNNSNGEYRFTTPTNNIGGTTPLKITLSEFILT
jgi:hypothetical protein